MKKLIIFYDNWCPNCSQFVKVVKKLDWLNLIDSKQLRNIEDTRKFSNLDLEMAKNQMASYANEWNYGYVSLYLIFIRIPIFWVFCPLFFILKITGLGQLLYKELAINRKIIPLHCDEGSCKI